MMDGIIIEPALPADWEDAMELAWRTFLKFEAPEYGKEGTDNFLNLISGEQLFKMFLNGDYPMVVARYGKKLTGMATVRTGNHISLLFTDAAFHRQGIGRGLLMRLQAIIYERTGSYRMTVNAAPYAIGFYEALGFTKYEDLKRADGITFQPMEIFRRIDP